jgi:hypothetical protein
MENAKNIEELLAAAGFSFTVVDRCPDLTCVICRGRAIAEAA